MKKKFKNQQGLPAIAHNIKFWQAGEIATILTIAVLLVIGTTTFISSLVLKNKNTTETKAAANDITISNIFSDTGELIILQNGKCGILEENGQGKIVRNNNGTPVDGLANCQETDFAPVYSKFFTYAKTELKYEEAISSPVPKKIKPLLTPSPRALINSTAQSPAKYTQLNCLAHKGDYSDLFYATQVKESNKIVTYYYEDDKGKKVITNTKVSDYRNDLWKWCNKDYSAKKCAVNQKIYYLAEVNISKAIKRFYYYKEQNLLGLLGYADNANIRTQELQNYCGDNKELVAPPVVIEASPIVVNTLIPTPFCQNIKIPKIPEGFFAVGAVCTNGNNDCKQYDLAKSINNYVEIYTRSELKIAKNEMEVKNLLVQIMFKGLLDSTGNILNDISKKTPLAQFSIKMGNKNFIIPGPFRLLQGELKVVSLTSKLVGYFGKEFNIVVNLLFGKALDNVCN